MRVLVTGGSASGKSALAERIAASLPAPHVYVATMCSYGKEGPARVAKHRSQRAELGFLTVEMSCGLESACLAELCCAAPEEEAAAFAAASAAERAALLAAGTVLVEDLGNLVANELFGEGEPSAQDPAPAAQRILAGIEALARQCANIVVVANELGADGTPLSRAMLDYIECAGAVACALAARADTVIECAGGIPNVLKGVWR